MHMCGVVSMIANLLWEVWKRPTPAEINYNLLQANSKNDMNVNYNYSQFRVPPKLVLEVLILLRRVPRQLLRKRGRAGRTLLPWLTALAAGVAAVPVVLAISQSVQTQ